VALHWAEVLTNRPLLEVYYSTVPPLSGIALRSVHLDRAGPTLTLRLALPEFPDRPLPEWVEAGYDRFQCQVQFLGVAELNMRGWRSGAVADVTLTPESRRRVRVVVAAEGVSLTFTASDHLTVGKPSAYRVDANGERHSYIRKVDRLRLRDGLPEVWDRSFHGRV